MSRIPSYSRAKDLSRNDTIIEKEIEDDWVLSEST